VLVKVRSELPTGTVTFLFSDIEGSTRLLQSLGEGYPDVLETHQRLLRDAFGARGGTVVSTEGDSFFVVFPDAGEALAAAVASQRALEDHEWPEGARVKVRMGLHTGQGTLGGDNYVGLDVHRAARIAASGRGGQLLVSTTTRSLVEDALPDDVTLRDLGGHGLRDLEIPERLYQVVIPGLASDFPPIRSAEPRQGNLPTPLTSFVGRERALRDVKDLVRRSKLVTLTGPGGTGKTSLALRVAADIQAEMEDGAFLVRLGSISDPDLVIPTIANALGIADQSDRRPLDLLTEHLRAKNVLLVLDNFEQLMAATAQVGELLALTPRVRTLATSREPLGLRGEQQYPVQPLETPDLENLPSLDRLARYEAISLFVERAAAVRQGFELTTENAATIAEICARLDGLPLAIELAAATTKVLNPQALLARLVQRLPLLGGASRDVPNRQRTLRDTIAWSHDLLDERDRALFACVAVFAGGFTLAAAEAVCDDGRGDTFEGVASLVNKSLLRQVETTGEDPRFAMLSTIREFAADQLAAGGQAEALERRHAEHFLALAEGAEPELTGSRSTGLLDALATDQDNLRAALDRATARGWLDLALRLGAALWRFWQMRGHLREGRERLNRLLALPDVDGHPRALIRALGAAGSVAYWMGDFPAAQVAYQRAVDLSRETGDVGAVAESLYNLSFVFGRAEQERSVALLHEAAAIFEQVGDRAGRAKVLWGLSDKGEDEAVTMATSLEALEIFQDLGDRFHEGWALWAVANSARRLGRHDESQARLGEGLKLFRDAGDVSAVAVFLGSFSDLAAVEGKVERMFRLAGAEAAAGETTDTGLEAAAGAIPIRQQLMEQFAADADAARFWAEGQAMSLDEAVAYAITPAAAAGTSPD
jgi:predicted ATPase/class 3 adenylate cyclase